MLNDNQKAIVSFVHGLVMFYGAALVIVALAAWKVIDLVIALARWLFVVGFVALPFVAFAAEPIVLVVPLDHPATIGGEFHGKGNGRLTKNGKLIQSNMRGNVTEYQSRFSPAETFRGSFYDSGHYALVGIENPEIGTLIAFGKGTGSGEHYLHDRTWANFRTAIQFGEKVTDPGCDSTTIERCTIRDCDVAIRFCNTMALTNEIKNLAVANVTTVIRLEAGGKSMADGIYVNGASEANKGGSVLEIDPVPGGIGSNNNRFTLRNVNYDQQAGPWIALARMKQHLKSGYWLTIDGGGCAFDGYGAGNYLLELRNPFHVTVRNFQGLQKGSVKIHHDRRFPPGKLVIDGCELRGVNFVAEILADDSPVGLEVR